jgi:carboxypeptidase PM20D1
LTRLKRWARPIRLTGPVVEMPGLGPSQFFPLSFFLPIEQPLLGPLLHVYLEQNPLFAPLIRNTVSLTMLKSGQKSNIIPDHAEAKLDIRLLPGENPQAVLADLSSLISDPKVSIEAEELPINHSPSTADTEFFRALAETLRVLGRRSLVCFTPPGAAIPFSSAGAG